MLIGPDFIMNFETTELKVNKLLSICQKKNLLISIAESCTGGMLSSKLTSVSGSSKVFKFGLVDYSNKSKIDILHISKNIIKSGTIIFFNNVVSIAEIINIIKSANIVKTKCLEKKK